MSGLGNEIKKEVLEDQIKRLTVFLPQELQAEITKRYTLTKGLEAKQIFCRDLMILFENAINKNPALNENLKLARAVEEIAGLFTGFSQILSSYASPILKEAIPHLKNQPDEASVFNNNTGKFQKYKIDDIFPAAEKIFNSVEFDFPEKNFLLEHAILALNSYTLHMEKEKTDEQNAIFEQGCDLVTSLVQSITTDLKKRDISRDELIKLWSVLDDFKILLKEYPNAKKENFEMAMRALLKVPAYKNVADYCENEMEIRRAQHGKTQSLKQTYTLQNINKEFEKGRQNMEANRSPLLKLRTVEESEEKTREEYSKPQETDKTVKLSAHTGKLDNGSDAKTPSDSVKPDKTISDNLWKDIKNSILDRAENMKYATEVDNKNNSILIKNAEIAVKREYEGITVMTEKYPPNIKEMVENMRIALKEMKSDICEIEKVPNLKLCGEIIQKFAEGPYPVKVKILDEKMLEDMRNSKDLECIKAMQLYDEMNKKDKPRPGNS